MGFFTSVGGIVESQGFILNVGGPFTVRHVRLGLMSNSLRILIDDFIKTLKVLASVVSMGSEKSGLSGQVSLRVDGTNFDRYPSGGVLCRQIDIN